MKGKLIVIEGSDGAGKATQLALLKDFLEKSDVPVKTIDFPRYRDSFYGKFIARFLQGDFGNLSEINPYLISLAYAMDRAEAREEMDGWLKKGNIVLSNRYATSNLAHQSTRLVEGEREEFIKWDLELEYTINRIPKEDLVIYLHVPYTISKELLQRKKHEDPAYVHWKQDIVEADDAYLRESEKAYLALAKRFAHWVTIECVDDNVRLRSKEDILEEIVAVLAEKGIIEESQKSKVSAKGGSASG